MNELSRNEPFFGPPVDVLEAVARRSVKHYHKYPGDLYEQVLSQLSGAWAKCGEELLITRGVDEALDIVLRHFLQREVTILKPDFSGFAERLLVAGRKCRAVPLSPGFQLDTVQLAFTANQGLLLVSSPHNPCGVDFPAVQIRDLANQGYLVFLDRAYRDFADDPDHHEKPHANIMRYYSFSKAHALAGMRLGALVVPAQHASALRRLQGFLPIDCHSLLLIQAALTFNWARTTAHEITETRRKTVLELKTRSIPVVDTQTNFVLVAESRTKELREHLECRGFRVASTEPFGLPNYLRVSIGLRAEMERIVLTLVDWKQHERKP